MAQARVRRKSHARRSHQRRHPAIKLSYGDTGVAKVAQIEYNITMKDIMDYLEHRIEEMKKSRQEVLKKIEEAKRRGERPHWTTGYYDYKIPVLQRFLNTLKSLKNDKERWEYIERYGSEASLYSPAFILRNVVFDRLDFPVASKLIGREIVDLDEGSREFMTEDEVSTIRYWDKDGRVYSVWVQWKPETEKPPFKGTITFFWDEGYEG